MNFKEKVQSMTASQIILLMVESLRNPVIPVNMDTYGRFYNNEVEGKVCQGCAATNMNLSIIGMTGEDLWLKFNKIGYLDASPFRGDQYVDLEGDINFIPTFEMAINNLRIGNIEAYNIYAEELQLAPIKQTRPVARLDNAYTYTGLETYELLAKEQNS